MESFETRFGRVGAMVLAGFLMLLGVTLAASADAKKPWQPIYVNPNPHGLKQSALTGWVGPDGRTVKCHGKPLLIDPRLTPPRRSDQTLRTIITDGETVTGPDSVVRCGHRGKVAWYLSTRDPLRKKRFRGARRFSIPIGQTETSDFSFGGYVVNTGGCYPREDGPQPPCAPPFRPEIELPAFRVYPQATIRVLATVDLTSTELSGHIGGDAAVEVQMTVDHVAVGQKAETVMNGDAMIRVRLDTGSQGYRGRHVVGLRLSGRGFNYVNVRATSASLKAFVSRRMG